MKKLAKGLVGTCNLPTFAHDVVEVQLEKGMESSRYGWDDPEQCSVEELQRLQLAATERENWAAATCYSAMLAAREHNEV